MSTENGQREQGSPLPGNHLRCPKDWDQAYLDGTVPWDLGRAPPMLEAVVAELAARGVTGGGADGAVRVFVPGAGRGHDARAWAGAGFEVTALEISPTAIAEAKALDAEAGLDVTWVEGDLFDLPEALEGAFEIVWEQTCFCAFDPGQRADYVRAVERVLVPDGSLMGIFWDVGRPGGPPFPVTAEDVQRHFGRAFYISPPRPIEPWTDQRWDEIFVEMQRTP